jgi:hypothetical protein
MQGIKILMWSVLVLTYALSVAILYFGTQAPLWLALVISAALLTPPFLFGYLAGRTS